MVGRGKHQREATMTTKAAPIPQGMHAVTPNLTIKGCAKAIEFYKEALDAVEASRFPSPDGTGILHAELRVGDSVVFMNDEMPGSDVRAPSREHRSPASFWLYSADCDAAFERAVKAGATAKMAPADMFWGDRCGMVADPFGYNWTFATHVKDMTRDEMRVAGEEFARQMAGGG
jgi:PhnB protein